MRELLKGQSSCCCVRAIACVLLACGWPDVCLCFRLTVSVRLGLASSSCPNGLRFLQPQPRERSWWCLFCGACEVNGNGASRNGGDECGPHPLGWEMSTCVWHASGLYQFLLTAISSYGARQAASILRCTGAATAFVHMRTAICHAPWPSAERTLGERGSRGRPHSTH